MNRYPDRHDNFTGKPWPVSPYDYPLIAANTNRRWPAVLRVFVYGIIGAAGLVAVCIGMAAYL